MERSVPTKTVRLGPNDKPFITRELKILDRKRKREYYRNGKSQHYLDLSDQFGRKFKLAGKQFLQKNVDNMMEAKPGQAYKVLKRLGADLETMLKTADSSCRNMSALGCQQVSALTD